MVAQRHPRMSVAEYLALERNSDIKHEYLDGEVYAMAGAKEGHNLITGNVVTALNVQLRHRPCRVYPSDMRVKLPTGLRTYPDVSIVCDKPQFEDDERDTLLNPEVIIEVLSPSTEKYDRGRKFQHYRTLTSLQEYILISQEAHRVERYLRQGDGTWVLSDIIGLDSSITLTKIDCTLQLADIYAKVDLFDDTEDV